ncbi:MAG: hypothetical protein COB85_03695 [Bacteroidetes bacterium]|nr:MAG: hypothetical protein COB85_03695 [Bacteroidota bacterium]
MSFLRCLILTLIISLSALSCYAQNQMVVDSLNRGYLTAEHDTEKVHYLFELGNVLIGPNPDTVLIIEMLIQSIAEKNLASPNKSLKEQYLFFKAEALNNIGYIHDDKGNIKEALSYYEKSLEIKKILSQSNDQLIAIAAKKGIAESLNNIGYIHNYRGAIASALDYYSQSLKIRETLNDRYGIANSLNNIGMVYKAQDDLDEALNYYLKSLKIKEELNHKYGIGESWNNIGEIHTLRGNLKEALECYQKSTDILLEIGEKVGSAIALNNIGSVHIELDNMEVALSFFQKSLKIRETIGDKKGIAEALNNIGIIRLERGEPEAARECADRCMRYSKELGYPEYIKRSANLLKKIYLQESNYKSALEMYELYTQMSDSIKNEATVKATIRQQTKYEFEKAQLIKEQATKELIRVSTEKMERRDNLQYSVILISILVLFGSILALGFFRVSERTAEGTIFFSFLILFEFFLVLADPYIDNWSGGAPGFKLLFNAGIAALIFPAHAFFEDKLKARLTKR